MSLLRNVIKAREEGKRETDKHINPRLLQFESRDVEAEDEETQGRRSSRARSKSHGRKDSSRALSPTQTRIAPDTR